MTCRPLGRSYSVNSTRLAEAPAGARQQETAAAAAPRAARRRGEGSNMRYSSPRAAGAQPAAGGGRRGEGDDLFMVRVGRRNGACSWKTCENAPAAGVVHQGARGSSKPILGPPGEPSGPVAGTTGRGGLPGSSAHTLLAKASVLHPARPIREPQAIYSKSPAMNPPAVSLLARPRRRGWGWVIFATAGIAGVFLARVGCVPVRADETVTRRIQEELRKRNLYFGDVDGRPSPQLSAALHRYQERKGFSSTGETDANTLDSLNIAQPATRRRPPPPPRPARRRHRRSTPATGGCRGPTSPSCAATRPGRARPRARRRPSPARPKRLPARRPPSPPRRRPPPPAGCSAAPRSSRCAIICGAISRPGRTTIPRARCAFYGEQVAYYDEGNVDHAYIARDVDRYDRRWPERRFALIEPGDGRCFAGRRPGQIRGEFPVRVQRQKPSLHTPSVARRKTPGRLRPRPGRLENRLHEGTTRPGEVSLLKAGGRRKPRSPR